MKQGFLALAAIACVGTMPAANAAGNFFVSGQVGQARYDDTDFDYTTARTHALSGGYRWSVSPTIQVGVEGGFGKVGEVESQYHYGDGFAYVETGRVAVAADYRHVGANARFVIGEDSPWFAIARAGYMAYSVDAELYFEARMDGALIDSYSESIRENGGGAYFGAGLGVEITRNVSISAMYNGYAHSNLDDGEGIFEIGTASTTTLGVEVRF